MLDTIELARGTIAAEHTLIIQLTRDLDTARELIVLVWPERSTRVEPNRLGSTAHAVGVVLAEARVQLAAIRRAER